MRQGEFSWRVGKNAEHPIPEGAKIFAEGPNQRRVEFSLLELESGISVRSSKLKKASKETRLYWKVDGGPEHEIPDAATISTKIHPKVTADIFLSEYDESTSHCMIKFIHQKSSSLVVESSEPMDSVGTLNPVVFKAALPYRNCKGSQGVEMYGWSLQKDSKPRKALKK